MTSEDFYKKNCSEDFFIRITDRKTYTGKWHFRRFLSNDMHEKNYFYLRNFTGSRLIREILHEMTNLETSTGKLLIQGVPLESYWENNLTMTSSRRWLIRGLLHYNYCSEDFYRKIINWRLLQENISLKTSSWKLIIGGLLQ